MGKNPLMILAVSISYWNRAYRRGDWTSPCGDRQVCMQAFNVSPAIPSIYEHILLLSEGSNKSNERCFVKWIT